MKWFNHRTWIQYQEDIKVKRGHELDMYLPWIIRIANQFPRHQIAIGCLDINDLIQAGNLGLIEAWTRVDHTRTQAEIWSFIKKRVKFSIRREIDKYANEIKIPRQKLDKARANLTKHEKILVNIFPKFWDKTAIQDFDHSSWKSILLEEFIDDALNKYVKNINHRDMLKRFYGIGFDKESGKELAIRYNTTISNIQNTILKTRNKIKTEEFEKIIENFYNSW